MLGMLSGWVGVCACNFPQFVHAARCYPLCVTTNFTNSISSDSEIGNMAIPAYSIKEVISSILNVNTICISHSDSEIGRATEKKVRKK